MSNSTSTATNPPTTSSTAPSATTTPPVSFSSSTANSSPTSATPNNPSSSTSGSISLPPSSSSSQSSSFSSSSSVFSSSTAPPSSSTTQPPSSTTPPPSSSLVTQTVTPTESGQPTVTQVVTSTQPAPSITPTNTSSSASSTSTSSPAVIGSKSSSGHGLGTGGTIAVAVVVPIVAVALIVLAGLYFWRKRKQRKDAEELRRKEVEEYGYNPNNDPTLPAVGATGSDGPFEMREDGSSGYRGWGTTAVASSSGRKASTTLSGGQSAGGIGMAYSEGTSPTHGPVSDTRSDNHLVDGRPLSGETEALGAMGPAAAGNRSGDINRGPSNASSSYSAANRSDGSGEVPAAGGGYYNNQYDTGNPYTGETQYGSPPGGRAEMPGQPVIRDVQARRNTRIENPSHFPQQSAGISQNF